MSMRLASFAITGACLAVSATGAFGCGTGAAILNDPFDTLQANVWGTANDQMAVKNGQLVISETNGRFYMDYESAAFDNVDFCADVELTSSTDETSSYGGLTFWSSDPDHFYTFLITLDGYAAVREYASGKWTYPIRDRAFAAIKQGVGEVNELRVVTQGTTATLYVNGQKFDAITDMTAPALSHFGFTVQAPSDGATSFALDNVAANHTGSN